MYQALFSFPVHCTRKGPEYEARVTHELACLVMGTIFLKSVRVHFAPGGTGGVFLLNIHRNSF